MCWCAVQCQSAEDDNADDVDDDDMAAFSDCDEEQVPAVRLIPQTYMTRQAPAFPADTATAQPPTPADRKLNTDYVE